MNFHSKTFELLTIDSVLEFDQVKTYFEDNVTLDKSGTFTILANQYLGSFCFYNIQQESLKQFIAQADTSYLVQRLFKIQKWRPIQTGEEFIKWFAKNALDELKEARTNGVIDQYDLRSAYNEIVDLNFDTLSEFFNELSEDTLALFEKVYEEDWIYQQCPEVKSEEFIELSELIQIIQSACKH